jgi:hypothetical protein
VKENIQFQPLLVIQTYLALGDWDALVMFIFQGHKFTKDLWAISRSIECLHPYTHTHTHTHTHITTTLLKVCLLQCIYLVHHAHPLTKFAFIIKQKTQFKKTEQTFGSESDITGTLRLSDWNFKQLWLMW